MAQGSSLLPTRQLPSITLFAMVKAMKAMKAKKVSKRMAKVVAFRGGNTGGATTLKQGDLIKNKQGRIVSKKQSVRAKKAYASGIGKWTAAVQKARKALGTKGFVAIKKGSPLYKKAREFFC